MIASVFEAGPPPSLSSTPERSCPTSDSDSNSLPRVQTSSPLAKLYGPSGNGKKGRRSEKRSKMAQTQTDDDEENGSEIQRLKKELAEVRGSQMRMEEMMGRLLAGRDQ